MLLTQVGESGERAIALDEGADDYLNKPFDPYELLARLRAVLRRARPGRRPLSASPTLRALATALQAAEPAVRLYILISPSLLAGLAGLLGTGRAGRRRADAPVGPPSPGPLLLTPRCGGPRPRPRRTGCASWMRLDHELKNPLTAIRAGLANIDLRGPPAADGTSAAVASVSAQADRITRLVGDLRKLADLETQEIETAPATCPACCTRWPRPRRA